MLSLPKEVEQYLTDHREFENNGAAKAPAWLKEIRAVALGEFSKAGFPTVSQEDWKFTNILPLTKIPFRHASAAGIPAVNRDDAKKFIVEGSAQSLLVFLNGHFAENLSTVSGLPREIVAGSMKNSLDVHGESIRAYIGKHLSLQNHPFAALNTAFLHDGAFVYVPAGIHTSIPIQLLFLAVGPKGKIRASYPRNLIIVGKGASATIVESYAVLDNDIYLSNTVTEVFAEEESALDFIKIQWEGDKAYHIGTTQIEQKERSRVTAFSLALGASISRNDINITVRGRECETMLDGLYIAADDQLVDHHTFIDHTQPGCSSREIFKGIITGNSRSVFNGKIFVRREAQKTDSKQTNKNLLLSDKATVDTKPQLEIFADDVKCTHGATVGGLDAASLFYVKSRGIGEEAGRALLTAGFASEVTNYINNEGLRRHVDALIVRRLQEKVVTAALPEIVHSETKTL